MTEAVLGIKVGDGSEFEKIGDSVRAAAVVRGEAVVLLDPVS